MFIYSVIYFIRFESKRVTKILFASCMYVVNTLPFKKKKKICFIDIIEFQLMVSTLE